MRKLFFLAFTLLMAVTSASAYVHTENIPGGGTWSYNSETRVLTIDAETIPDYNYTTDSDGRRKSTSPWANSSDAIYMRDVYFTAQVKTIGKNAFCGMLLSEVDFEESTNLVTIKENAFFQSGVSYFDFSRVKQIDEWAFYGTPIGYVYLPAIETINGAPFTNCTYLLREPSDEMGLHFMPSIVIESGTRDLHINGAIANYTDYAYGKKVVIMANMRYLGTQWSASVQATVRSFYNKLVFGERVNWGTTTNREGNIGSFWYVDENKRVIVDYNGNDMPDYYYNSAPWWYMGPSAKEVHIFYAGDKAVGDYAFSKFAKLTKVEFHANRAGKSVNAIGERAFIDCPLLTDIRLENVTTIGNAAFAGCAALTYADLSSCTSIGQWAFNQCSLSNIYFSDKINTLDDNAFNNAIANNGHIYITRATPPTTYSHTFSNINQSTITLHLSESQGDAYNVSPWSAFNRTATGTELYGVFSGSTMTIYYDGSRVSRGGYTDWTASSLSSNRANVTKVIFDASVDNARPTSTWKWFRDFVNMTKIEGIQYLHTNQVTDMYGMFQNCKKLASVDLSGFNTSNVTDIRSIFENCESLTTLDVNSFDLSKITSVLDMFDGCKNLVSIYCDKDWSEYTNITYRNSMFEGCVKLKGGMGTAFDATETALTYAHPDGGSEAPGYFWRAGDKGYDPYAPIEPDPVGTLCEVSGNGDFEDVVHSQFEDSNFESQGELTIAFFTNDSMYFDLAGTGDLVTAGLDGYVYVVTIEPTSMDDLRGMYTLQYRGGGVITVEQGEMTAIDRYVDGSVNISLNEEETAYVAVISMELQNGETLSGVVTGLCGGNIPADPKYNIYVSGGFGEPYETNGHDFFMDSISSQNLMYAQLKTGEELAINVRNIEDGWQFDHWTINGENAGSARPLSYTVADADANIVAHYIANVTYYKVFVVSAHGTVYDQNGTPLETYMGAPCFYADGELSLNVSDIEEGWEFDHWQVDDVNVGSDLPYELIATEDNTVVTAVYTQASTPAQLEETYICDFTTKATGNANYSNTWTYDGEWTVFGGANNNKQWDYVKMGGKSATIANANPVYVMNKNGFDKEIKGVNVYFNATSLSKSGMSINSWGVKVYSDLACTELLYTVAGSEYGGDTDTITVSAGDSEPWSAGYAIQVYWDLANTSSTNGIIGVDKIAFLTEAGGTGTDIDEIVNRQSSNRKFIKDGQIYIIRDGKTYTIMGAEVR